MCKVCWEQTVCVCVFIQPGRIRLDFRELVSVRTGQVTGKRNSKYKGPVLGSGTDGDSKPLSVTVAPW